MIGGIVKETNTIKQGVEIVVEGTGCEQFDTLAIKVVATPEARSVSEGDSIWWQGHKAFWQPKSCKEVSDVVLEKVSNSYFHKD